jgi:ribosomal protein L11 methyltransferase
VAAALGAGWLQGVDNDPVALSVAGENLAKNRVPPERYLLQEGDLVHGIDRQFDIVAANILTPVVLKLLDRLEPVLSPGGLFIGSGVLEENAAEVSEKMTERGLAVIEIRKWDGWAALAGRKDG